MLGLLSKLIEPVFGVIDKAVPDKDLAQQLKHDVQTAMIAQESAFVDAARDVVLAEAQGSFLQRNWRPIVMLLIAAILGNNFLIAPYVQAFGGVSVVLEIPEGLWTLFTIGMGGYVVGRTFEKTGSHIRLGANKPGP